MKVWGASFRLAQERLGFVLLAGLVFAMLAQVADKLGVTAEIDTLAGFVPRYLGIGNPLLRLGLVFATAWIALSIVFTIATRLRIRRDIQVRKKG